MNTLLLTLNIAFGIIFLILAIWRWIDYADFDTGKLWHVLIFWGVFILVLIWLPLNIQQWNQKANQIRQQLYQSKVKIYEGMSLTTNVPMIERKIVIPDGADLYYWEIQ